MRNSGLEEAQAGIKNAGRNINNHSYADDTTLVNLSVTIRSSCFYLMKSCQNEKFWKKISTGN